MQTLDPKFIEAVAASNRWIANAAEQPAKSVTLSFPTVDLTGFESASLAVEAITKEFALLAEIARSSIQVDLEFMTVGMKQSSALAKAGWLAHASLPVQLVDDSLEDPQRLSVSLEDHYRKNWPHVREALLVRLQSYSIDDEAKAAFRELVDAHGYSLYRLVCPKVFTEIERVVRVELHNDDISVTITSQKHLQELAGEMDHDAVDLGNFFHLEAYKKLTEHSYVNVKTDEAREQIRLDAVPNRHAALHGIMPYSSFKSSLNAIFLIDYVFQIITAFKLRGTPHRQSAM